MFQVTDADLETITIALTCLNLQIKPDSSLRRSSYFSWYKNSSVPKNEKRYIKLYQSAYFKGPKKPPSLRYDPIYKSEIIEDDPNIKPAKLAQIKFPPILDCNIRLQVFYSSSLTSKEVLLASTEFQLRDLLQRRGGYDHHFQSILSFKTFFL